MADDNNVNKKELKIWEYKCFCFFTCIDFPKQSNFSLNLCMMSSFVCGYNRLLNKVPLSSLECNWTLLSSIIIVSGGSFFLYTVVAVYKIFP